jgi:ribose transport system substrate-binding protein
MQLFKTTIFALAAMTSLMLSGCNSGSPADNSAPAANTASNSASTTPTGKKFTIGVSQCNEGEPYRAQMDKDIVEAAKAHPELTVIVKDAGNDSLKQKAHMEEFVQQKVDLIIISPKEAQPLTKPVAEAMAAGIPVVILDREIVGDDYTCFIGADNKIIGKAAGAWLNKKLAGGGTIVELKGLMTSTPALDRHEGFVEGMKGSTAKVAFEGEMQWLEPEARKAMESALARLPKIDAVYAHTDPGAHGAYLAANAAGREKEMIFIGIDALPNEGRVWVKEGLLAVSFEYPTGGKEAIDAAWKILNKESVEKKIVLPSKFFTPENVDKGGEPISG